MKTILNIIKNALMAVFAIVFFMVAWTFYDYRECGYEYMRSPSVSAEEKAECEAKE